MWKCDHQTKCRGCVSHKVPSSALFFRIISGCLWISVSLRSSKHICHKSFSKTCIVYIHVNLLAVFPVFLSSLQPPVDQWNGVKPLAATCFLSPTHTRPQTKQEPTHKTAAPYGFEWRQTPQGTFEMSNTYIMPVVFFYITYYKSLFLQQELWVAQVLKVFINKIKNSSVHCYLLCTYILKQKAVMSI